MASLVKPVAPVDRLESLTPTSSPTSRRIKLSLLLMCSELHSLRCDGRDLQGSTERP